MVSFSIPHAERSKTLEDILAGLDNAHSKVISVLLALLVFLSIIQVSVNVGLMEFTAGQRDMLVRIMISTLIAMVATLFLKLTTAVLDKFFFFLDPTARGIVLRTWNYVIAAITLLFILGQYTGRLESIGISLGVFSAGLAIALQQPLTSALGWIVIMSKKTYKVGDRIFVKGIKGDVYEISMFYTVVMQVGGELGGDDPTGIKISLPNSFVLTEPVMNYSSDFPFVWDHVKVSVTYESDPELARTIIKQAAQDIAGETMKKAVERMKPYLYGTQQESELSEEPLVFTNFAESSLVVRVKYLVKVNRRHYVKSQITERIMSEFTNGENAGKVIIAYPHTELVFHDQSLKGIFRDAVERAGK